MDRVFLLDELYYDCNPVVDATRLAPAAVLLLFSLAVWRARQPADRTAVSWKPRFEDAAFFFLAAVSVLPWLVDPADRERAWWGPLAVAGALTLAVSMVEARASPRGAAVRRGLPSLWRNVFPALCALVTVGLLVALLFVNSYLAWPRGPQVRALHEAVRAISDEAFAQHDAARGYRGVTMGMTVIVRLVAAWTVAGLWWRNALRYSGGVTVWVAGLAAVLALVLGLLGASHVLLGFGGAAGNTLLCAAWRRDETPEMAVVTDAFNAIGIYLPVALALGVCLLLEPVGQPLEDDRLQSVAVRRFKAQARLDRIAERARSLDTLIYLGAVGLVFGTLQISATYASALSHLPTATAVKATTDLCKAVGWPAASPAAAGTGRPDPLGLLASACAASSAECVGWAASAARAAALATQRPAASPAQTPAAELLRCAALAKTQVDLDIADSARQFAKQTTLTFGIAFSAILVALYLPAMLLLRDAAGGVARQLGLADDAERNALLTRMGIESDYVGKLGRLIAALSPLVAGLLTSALSGA